MCNGSVSVSSFLTKVGRLEEDVAECRTAKKKITDEAELERRGLTHKLREKVSGREKKSGSGGIRTHAIEMTGALNQRLRPLGHATNWLVVDKITALIVFV